MNMGPMIIYKIFDNDRLNKKMIILSYIFNALFNTQNTFLTTGDAAGHGWIWPRSAQLVGEEMT